MSRATIMVLLLVLIQACTPEVDAGTASKSDWPAICDSAITQLLLDLTQSEKDKIAAMKENDLILLHHGFGTGIRNQFGLWGGNSALIKDCSGSKETHPDDVSMIIIERLWKKLQ